MTNIKYGIPRGINYECYFTDTQNLERTLTNLDPADELYILDMGFYNLDSLLNELNRHASSGSKISILTDKEVPDIIKAIPGINIFSDTSKSTSASIYDYLEQEQYLQLRGEWCLTC